MKHRYSLPTFLIVPVIVCFSLAASCESRKADSRQDKNPVVSSAPLPSPQAIPSVAAVPPEELSYGEGDCAPRFANGMRGTCINGKPCNGFGVKDQTGKIECECFGTKGGCPEGQVCSVIKRACVPPQDAER